MIAVAGCLILYVSYRRPPAQKFPAGHTDCYAATGWTTEHAANFGADPAPIVVVGILETGRWRSLSASSPIPTAQVAVSASSLELRDPAWNELESGYTEA